MTPVAIVSIGRLAMPFTNTYVAMTPERAPVGPMILKLLPPNIAAMRPAQMAVMIPMSGVALDATASETESGIDMRETVRPERKFCCIRSNTKFMQLQF